VIGLCVAVVLGLGVLALVLRSKSNASSPQVPIAEQPAAAAIPSAAPAPLILNPDLAESAANGSTPAKATAHATEKPASASPPPAAALPSLPSLVNPQPGTLHPVPAAVSAPPANTARAVRCYSDPFTGQIRVAGAGHTSDSFACQQNPFTGAYQRK
jgi:hypothetical protein